MDTIFMNCEIRKVFKSHVLILNLTDKIDLGRGEKFLSNLSIDYTRKNILESNTTTINSKYQLQHGMTNLNYLIDQYI